MGGYIRTDCVHCGEYFDFHVGPEASGTGSTPCCPICRDEIIALMKSYTPREREAYLRGRLAAARDHNDHDMIRVIGKLLDKLRAECSS